MSRKKFNFLVSDLEKIANTVRQDIIKMLVNAGSGHTAGPLGLADIFTALYFRVLYHDPKKPMWEERDRLCLSCGHVVPVRYAVMARAGYFPLSELKTLRKINSRLQGHPSYIDMPALEHSSGPLGQGSSVAIGKALAAKINKQEHYVFCIVSDGEQQEGQTWEAAMFAGKMKLDNLIFIMDRNNIQIDGDTEEIMPLNPLVDKYKSFGWHVIEIDGNNMKEIIGACELAKTIREQPVMIIAHTVPGKGVSFTENDYRWHGSPLGTVETERAPSKSKQASMALKELENAKKQIFVQ
jgi:transketolase